MSSCRSKGVSAPASFGTSVSTSALASMSIVASFSGVVEPPQAIIASTAEPRSIDPRTFEPRTKRFIRPSNRSSQELYMFGGFKGTV